MSESQLSEAGGAVQAEAPSAAASASSIDGDDFLDSLQKLVKGSYKLQLDRGEALTNEQIANVKLYYELSKLSAGDNVMRASGGRQRRKRKGPITDAEDQDGSSSRRRVLSRLTSEGLIKQIKGVDVLRRTYFQFLSFWYVHL